jgi:hypothetical protein
MKNSFLPLCASLLLAGFSLSAQPGQPGAAPSSTPPGTAPRPADALYRFDLDFPGGTPGELVHAIQNQAVRSSEPKGGGGGPFGGFPGPGGVSTMPLNAIVPEEGSHYRFPPLHVKNVTVPELFETVTVAAQESPTAGKTGQSQPRVEPGKFATLGRPRNESIWRFYAPKSLLPEKACRFFQLRAYLDAYKIEDITTAIQTGWKMSGGGDEPALSFHKETTLLIAVGDPDKVGMIDYVLRGLDTGIQAARKAKETAEFEKASADAFKGVNAASPPK